MKKIYPILVMLVASGMQLKAQTLTPEVLASGGVFSSAGSYSLSQTFGELVVETAASGNSILTQGFQQPQSGQVSEVHDNSNGMHLSVYPNPAGSVIYVNIVSEKDVLYNIRISDALGKEISVSQYSSSAIGSVNVIDVSMLSSGLYFLNINSADNRFIKTIPLSKN